ncbi:MAG: hypothetical protein GWM98_24215 [Nitrospinaceae bacterium]|nr:hypothetical protein [Nitrospinaceae bacterium]NIR56998.1 hypothetical protein [Nitrospinaceae bacterium]NIS87455.1 hypothetical protein [Nitrospinaceae bacterium]NIT84304.1 hypothetical protein [Nitrospinaceae bacterium]NIU46494.1 hypothetical protein [Nitrospinaceae bacterium]
MESRNIIKICKGPGCRAWGADGLYSGLKAQSAGAVEQPKVCSSKCMNRCGGGTTVELVSSGVAQAFVKVRNSTESLPSLLCMKPATS